MLLAAFQGGPFFTNDAIILGILLSILAVIFYTESIETGFWKKFYTFVPSLLLCYFVPAFFHLVPLPQLIVLPRTVPLVVPQVMIFPRICMVAMVFEFSRTVILLPD